MIDWTYFKIPENLYRKIKRSGVREEAVRICAKNILMQVGPSEGLGIITSKEKSLAHALASFWVNKYKKALKQLPKEVQKKFKSKVVKTDMKPGDFVYMGEDDKITNIAPFKGAEPIGAVDAEGGFISFNLDKQPPLEFIKAQFHLSDNSCKICNGKKVLLDGQNEYPCPACGKKKKSNKGPSKLGARKVRVCEQESKAP